MANLSLAKEGWPKRKWHWRGDTGICYWRCCDCKGKCSFLFWATRSVDFLCLCRFKAYSTFFLLHQLFVGLWATGSVDFLCLCRLKAYSTFFLLQQLFVGVWAAELVASFFGVISFSDFSSWIFMKFQTQDFLCLCRFKAYSTFFLLQQLFVGLWATGSIDFLCLCRFKAYSTFFLLQQLFVGIWATESVASFFGVISFSDFSLWIFVKFQTQASVMLHLKFERGCWNI